MPVPLSYSIPDFFKLVGISRAGGYKLIRDGNGPPTFMIGGRMLVEAKAGERWIADLAKNNQTSKKAG